MRKSHFGEEQIALALRQVNGVILVEKVYRKVEMTETTFYRCKKLRSSLGSKLRPLR